MINASCPHCRTGYKLPDSQFGKHVRCKSCPDTFIVKAEEEIPTLEEATEADLRAARRRTTTLAEESPGQREAGDRQRGPAIRPGPPSRRHEENRSRGRDDEDRPSRRQRDDDDYDHREAGSGSSTMLIIIGGVAALFLLLVVGGGLAWYFASSSPPPQNVAQTGIAPAGDQGGDPNLNPNPAGGGGGFRPADLGNAAPPVSDPRAKDLPSALAMLKDASVEARRAGLRFLNEVPNHERERSRDEVGQAVKPLLSDSELGKEADNVLRGWHCREIIPRLQQELASNDFHVWVRALDPLGQIKHDEAAELLAKQLEIKGRAFWVRGHLEKQGKRAEKYVVKYLHHPDKGVRDIAKNLLIAYSTPSNLKVEQALADLESKDDETRKSCLETLSTEKIPAQQKASVARLAETLLSHREQDVRRMAIKALAESATEENVKGVNTALLDKDNEVREKALEIIGRLKSPDSIEPLVAHLNSPKKEQEIVVKLLLDYGARAEKTVQELLKSNSPAVRLAGLQLLAEIGTKDSLSMVMKLSKIDRGNAVAANLAIKKIQAREKEKTTKGKDREP